MIIEYLEGVLNPHTPTSIDTPEDAYDIFHLPSQRLIDALKKDECDLYLH